MWFYVQESGRLWRNGAFIGAGYSGHGDDRNQPEAQEEIGHGPIPCGHYQIEPPRDTETHGPYVLPLEPDATNEMWGRSDFLIHGDSIANPGTASHGCIILARVLREQIGQSGDTDLTVVAHEGQLLEA